MYEQSGTSTDNANERTPRLFARGSQTAASVVPIHRKVPVFFVWARLARSDSRARHTIFSANRSHAAAMRKLTRQCIAEVAQRHIATINTRQLPAAKWCQRTDLPRTRQLHSVVRMGHEHRPMVCQSWFGAATKDRCEIWQSH